MADTYTPHYSFTLVEVGASRDTWGAKTNQNWGVNDDRLSELQGQVNTNSTNITNNTTAITNTNNAFKAWMPIGVVVMWGQPSAVPSGFAICDGRTVARSDGGGNITTPNLIGRFIMASTGYGTTGGANSASGSAATDTQGYHVHGGATQGHTLTVNEIPSHSHTYQSRTQGFVNIGQGGGSINPGFSTENTTNTGGDAAHSHPIGGDGVHAHNVTVTVSILPSYFTMIFIMRV